MEWIHYSVCPEEYCARHPANPITQLQGVIVRVGCTQGRVTDVVLALDKCSRDSSCPSTPHVRIQIPHSKECAVVRDDLNEGDVLSVCPTGRRPPYGVVHCANLTTGNVWERRA